MKYLFKRAWQIALTLFIYATIVFVILIAAQPGGGSELLPGVRLTGPEPQPLYLQYLNFMKDIFTADLGISATNNYRPVWDIIKERLPRTAALFLAATLVYFLVGFRLGKWIAWRRGRTIDYAATVTGVTLWTVYTPWLGFLLIWIFNFKLRWLPIGKFSEPLIWRNYPGISDSTVFTYMMLIGGAALLFVLAVYSLSRKLNLSRPVSLTANLGAMALTGGILAYLLLTTEIGYLARDILWHLILPTFSLILVGFGGYMLLMRDSMVEVVREDFVMAAQAKGLPDKVVRDKHAARNALLPMVTSFALALAFALNGSIVTEKIFSWPGIGLTLLDAVGDNKDIPLAIGTFVFTGVFALIAHLTADVLYAYLDPRIRY